MLRNFPRRMSDHFFPSSFFASLSRKDLYPPSPPRSATSAAAATSPIPSFSPSSVSSPLDASSSRPSRKRSPSSSSSEALAYARKSADTDQSVPDFSDQSVPDFWEPSPPKKMAQETGPRRVGRSIRLSRKTPPPNMPPLTYSSSATTLEAFSPQEGAPHMRPRKKLSPIVDIGLPTTPFDPPPPVKSPQGPFTSSATPQQNSADQSLPFQKSPSLSSGASRDASLPQRRSFSTRAELRKILLKAVQEPIRIRPRVRDRSDPYLRLTKHELRIKNSEEAKMENKKQKLKNKVDSLKTLKWHLPSDNPLWPNLPRLYPLALASLGVDTPTKVQAEVIPLLASGKDAELYTCTGSGKTLAWLLPIHAAIQCELLDMQYHKQRYSTQLRCVIIVPTKELGYQFLSKIVEVGREMQRVLPWIKKKRPKRVDVEVYAKSDERFKDLLEKLNSAPPHIAIVTHNALRVVKSSIKMNTVKWLVLEEVDAILKGRDGMEVETFVANRKEGTQIVFSTATPTVHIKQLAKRFLNTDNYNVKDNTTNNNSNSNNITNNNITADDNNTNKIYVNNVNGNNNDTNNMTENNNDNNINHNHLHNYPNPIHLNINNKLLAPRDSTLAVSYQFPPSLHHQYLLCRFGAASHKQKHLLAFLKSRSPAFSSSSPSSSSSASSSDEIVRDPALIFVDEYLEVRPLALYLKEAGIVSAILLDDDPVASRTKVLMALRLKQVDAVVVCEDMARGLDLKGLSLVINMSVVDPIRYIHRAGRIARVGGWGQGLSASSTFGQTPQDVPPATVLTLRTHKDTDAVKTLQATLGITLDELSVL